MLEAQLVAGLERRTLPKERRPPRAIRLNPAPRVRCITAHHRTGSVRSAVLTFRCIVIDADRRRTSLVITLDGAPLVGDDLELPHGETVVVHHVTSSSRDGLAGVIIAGTTTD